MKGEAGFVEGGYAAAYHRAGKTGRSQGISGDQVGALIFEFSHFQPGEYEYGRGNELEGNALHTLADVLERAMDA